MYFTRTDCVQS